MNTHVPEKKKGLDRRVLILAAFLVVVIGGAIAALAYIAVDGKTVYIDKASISAPSVVLGPTNAGTLKEVYVSVNDTVAPNTVVAQVGTELIKSLNGGLVIAVDNNIGKSVDAHEMVVTVIDPTQLRVVGQVQEDKGLVDIVPGQRAVFTVDAFGSQQFSGIVDEVAPTDVNSDVVFSVSDQRQEQNFNVKIRFDQTAHPELKNGMSAKLWVYVK